MPRSPTREGSADDGRGGNRVTWPHLIAALASAFVLTCTSSPDVSRAHFVSDYEEHHVDFAAAPTGIVTISGEFFFHAEHMQHLRFAFRTDQTCLGPLVRDLRHFCGLAAP